MLGNNILGKANTSADLLSKPPTPSQYDALWRQTKASLHLESQLEPRDNVNNPESFTFKWKFNTQTRTDDEQVIIDNLHEIFKCLLSS